MNSNKIDYYVPEYYRFKYKGMYILLNIISLQVFIIDDNLLKIISQTDSKNHNKLRIKLNKTKIKPEIIRKIRHLHKCGILYKDINKSSLIQNRQNISDYELDTIDLILTSNCNLSCKYCFNARNVNRFKIMDLETSSKAIDFLLEKSRDRKKLRVCFFGGEPLLNFKILRDTVLYAEKVGLKNDKEFLFSLTTNATQFTDDIIKFLTDHNIKMLISIDGSEPSHDLNRVFLNGKGSHKSVINSINRLQRIGNKNYSARATVTPETITRLSRNIDFLRSLNFENVHFESNYISTKEDIKLLKQQYLDISKKIVKNYSIGNEYIFNQLSDPLIDIINRNTKQYFCRAGRGYIAVNEIGDIYLCHRLINEKRFCLGNINDLDKDLRLPQIFDPMLNEKEKCKTCWARYICGGGCYAINYEINNDINMPPDSFCEIKKYSIKMTLRIYADLFHGFNNNNNDN